MVSVIHFLSPKGNGLVPTKCVITLFHASVNERCCFSVALEEGFGTDHHPPWLPINSKSEATIGRKKSIVSISVSFSGRCVSETHQIQKWRLCSTSKVQARLKCIVPIPYLTKRMRSHRSSKVDFTQVLRIEACQRRFVRNRWRNCMESQSVVRKCDRPRRSFKWICLERFVVNSTGSTLKTANQRMAIFCRRFTIPCLHCTLALP